MSKNTSILSSDNWGTLLKTAFTAFPKIWWRIVTINILAVLMILLGFAITAGIGILLLGGMSAVESAYINFISTMNLTIPQWWIFGGLLFFWINWAIVFAITAKIANILVIKDYVRKQTTNPFVLYFQTAWSFFWRYVGLGFRAFWYIYWPILVLFIVAPIFFMFVKMVSAESLPTMPTATNVVSESIASEEVEDTKSMPIEVEETQKDVDKLETVDEEIPFDMMNDEEDYNEDYYNTESEYNSPLIAGIQDNMASILVGIGTFFLFLIFIIWRSVYMAFTSTHLIEHDQSAKEAFDASIKLVKGNWWAVFLSLSGFFLVVSFLPGMAFGMLSLLFPMMGIPMWISDVLTNLYSWIVVAPVGTAFIYFLMLHLMAQKKVS